MEAPPAPAPAAPAQLLVEKHVAYISRLNKKKDDFEYWATEHLRMSGLYWGLTALDLMGRLPLSEKEALVGWIVSCQHEDGGFGGNQDHDSHLLYTLSALQVLALFDALPRINQAACVDFVAKLQRPDGSFAGDEWGEVDTRFSYIALSALSLLGRLAAISLPLAVDYIGKCRNFDGGFGSVPGAESHAGQVFCCVGALAIAGALGTHADADRLGWWLAERQTRDGGLNGRPEKLADVCYSWWVLAAIRALDRLAWLDSAALSAFIFACQDADGGGIADKPGNVPDVFHTFFGLTGLALLGHPGLKEIDPVYALPVDTLRRLGIRPPAPTAAPGTST